MIELAVAAVAVHAAIYMWYRDRRHVAAARRALSESHCRTQAALRLLHSSEDYARRLAERDALVVRRDALLQLVAKLSRETPYPAELDECRAARSKLVAEVGTLRAARVEQDRLAADRVAGLEAAIAQVVGDRDAHAARCVELARRVSELERQTPFAMVREFHALVGQLDSPVLDITRYRELRTSLIAEEFKELRDALDANDVVEVADALADLFYVVVGSALQWGIPLDRVFAEVHRSNMTKGGGPKRADGKILKGPGYSPPGIAAVLDGGTP